MHIDEHKKLTINSGLPDPMRDKNEGRDRRGKREGTRGHGLSRRLLRVNRLRVELEHKSDDLRIK